MGNKRTRHKNISVEQIAQLEAKGLVHSGYDPIRDREVFHRALDAGATTNPKLIACEMYNNSGYDLIVAQVDGNLKWNLNKEKHLYFPHGYEGLQIQHRDGSPFQGSLLINYGDEIGKGNKLPSRPDAPKTKVYRRSV